MRSDFMRLSLALFLLTSGALAADVQWRVKAGDDPSWARPDFDDSGWTPGKGPSAEATTAGWEPGVRWYRTVFAVPDSWAGQPLSLAVGPLDDVYEVYVEGARVGQFGSPPPNWVLWVPRHKTFDIPAAAASARAIHVAIRRFTRQSMSIQSNHSTSGSKVNRHPPVLGIQAAIQDQEKLHSYAGILALSLDDILTLFMTLSGVICLGLFRNQRRRREYLMLGLAMAGAGLCRFCGIPLGLTEFAPQNGVLGTAVRFMSYAGGVQFLEILFLAELVPSDFVWLRRYLRAAGVILVIPVWSGQIAAVADLTSSRGTGINIWTSGAAIPIALGLAVWFWHRREPDSGALAFAVSLQIASVWFAAVFVQSGGRFGNNSVTRTGVIVDFRTVTAFLVSATMLRILWGRYRREQSRLMGMELELEAARTVQQLLFTGNVDGIEAVYRPAQEVGGDFYQVLPLEGGARLIVVGDVSGKGLKAAMAVSMVVGLLRRDRELSPAALLAQMNRNLIGTLNGGFVTCVAVRQETDGRTVLANAGHLMPYAAGAEVTLEAGLPLGIVDTEYTETTGRFGSLLLLSDGVVEAATPNGELFGFERTREMSASSAEEIAEAACAWGQTDDITVVTVHIGSGNAALAVRAGR